MNKYPSDDYYDEQDSLHGRIIDEDVEALSARIAAATLRQDYGFIEDVLMDAKARWRSEGRAEEKKAVADQLDHDMVWHRKRRYWFRTRDGLLGEHEIDAEIDQREMIALACRHPIELIKIGDMDSAKMAALIPTRRYFWRGERHRDGRPIYQEEGT